MSESTSAPVISGNDAKALQVASDGALPEYMKQYVTGERGDGLENFRAERDITIPRLVLLQALSPQVEQGLGKPGDILHSVSNEVLAAWPQGPNVLLGDPLEIVVIRHTLQWIEWNDREAGGGIKESSSDVNSTLAKRCEAGEKRLDKKGEVQAVTEYHNFLAWIPRLGAGLDGMVMVNCGKTNWKHGRNLITRMAMRGPGVPAYAGKYLVRAANEKNKQNQLYKVFKFENAGWTAESEFALAKQMAEETRGKKIETKMDEHDGDSARGTFAEAEM